MYYSLPGNSGPMGGWGIGIAESSDLFQRDKVGEITPAGEYEKNGLAVPSALLLDGKAQLFYQGNNEIGATRFISNVMILWNSSLSIPTVNSV